MLFDNATCHSVTKVISKVTVKVLPPNLTYEAQPSEQQTIRAVKLQYHWQTLRYTVTITETKNVKSDFNKYPVIVTSTAHAHNCIPLRLTQYSANISSSQSFFKKVFPPALPCIILSHILIKFH